jgi:diguanylate cyclase (GGDEF)-like protein
VHETAVAAGPGRRSVLREAMATGLSVLAGPSSTRHEPVLAGVLPGARSVIVVPFGADETAGLLVLEHARWSSQRGSRRVELRMIDTAEQAAGQAALAIGRAQLLAQARQAAQTDGLTRLANRRAFDERLAEETARAAAGGPPVTLIMIDLDHFKRLNDNHGHQAGDEVLRLVAQVLRDNGPAGSVPARYGGEELALILPGTGPGEGVEVAERIRAAIATAPGPVPVTASLGVAWGPGSGGSPHELLAAADAALYEAKRGGRNRVVPAWAEARAA